MPAEESIIAGAPRDTRTGQPIIPSVPSVGGEEMPSLGVPTPAAKPDEPDEADEPERKGKKGRKAAKDKPDDPPATSPVTPTPGAPAINNPPRHLLPFVDPDAPHEGVAQEFTGDPAVLPVPGTIAQYWYRSHVPGWLGCHVMVVVQIGPEPVLPGEGPGMEGCTLRSATAGHFKCGPIRPSPVPKLDHFTPVRKWRPDQLRIPPE